MFVQFPATSDNVVGLAASLMKDLRQNVHRFIPAGLNLLRRSQYQRVPANDVVFDSLLKTFVVVERIVFPVTVNNDVPKDLPILASLETVLGKSLVRSQSGNFVGDFEATDDELFHSRYLAADYKNMVPDFDSSSNLRHTRTKRRGFAKNRVV